MLLELLAGLVRLFDDPFELNGLLYIFGFTLAELLIRSILDNLSLKLFELVLLNLSLILIFDKLLVLFDIIFLELLLPLTNETFELKSLPYG